MGTTPTAQCGCFGAGGTARHWGWGVSGQRDLVLVVLEAHLSGSQQDLDECVCSPQGPPAWCHSAPEQLLPLFPIKLPSLPESCLLGVSEEGLGGIPQGGRDWRGAERALAWIRNGDPRESSCPPLLTLLWGALGGT